MSTSEKENEEYIEKIEILRQQLEKETISHSRLSSALPPNVIRAFEN